MFWLLCQRSICMLPAAFQPLLQLLCDTAHEGRLPLAWAKACRHVAAAVQGPAAVSASTCS
jgi:hypothetical protein